MVPRVEHVPQSLTCPTWCHDDVPAGSGFLHLSDDWTVPATADTTAASHVVVERCDGHPAAVRLEADGEPMTPVEAFALAAVLQVAAATAWGLT